MIALRRDAIFLYIYAHRYWSRHAYSHFYAITIIAAHWDFPPALDIAGCEPPSLECALIRMPPFCRRPAPAVISLLQRLAINMSVLMSYREGSSAARKYARSDRGSLYRFASAATYIFHTNYSFYMLLRHTRRAFLLAQFISAFERMWLPLLFRAFSYKNAAAAPCQP